MAKARFHMNIQIINNKKKIVIIFISLAHWIGSRSSYWNDKKMRASKTIIPSHNFILFIDHLNNAIELEIEKVYMCTFDAYHLTECYHRYKLESLHGTKYTKLKDTFATPISPTIWRKKKYIVNFIRIWTMNNLKQIYSMGIKNSNRCEYHTNFFCYIE